MDSLSQMALGAAISAAVMGTRVPLRRALLWGAVCGTLPDLDVLIDYGDPVRNMVLHRAETHALFWLSLAAPLVAGLISALHRDRAHMGRWCLAVWLVLLTHPMLDAFTVYGTRLFLPFSDHPHGLGSVFIIDPLYTLPLLVAIAAALRRPAMAPRACAWGLGLSSLYLLWSVAAQQWVRHEARSQLQAQGLPTDRVLVTPTPFNTVIWRVVAIDADADAWYEGYRGLLDRDTTLRFDRYPRGGEALARWAEHPPVAALTAFSHGYVDAVTVDGELRIRDLRMGQAPYFHFSFTVARDGDQGWVPQAAERVGERPPLGPGLRALGHRLRERGAPPR